MIGFLKTTNSVAIQIYAGSSSEHSFQRSDEQYISVILLDPFSDLLWGFSGCFFYKGAKRRCITISHQLCNLRNAHIRITQEVRGDFNTYFFYFIPIIDTVFLCNDAV